MTGPQPGRECTHWDGAAQQHCRATDHVRPFLTGPRCPAHTPNALAGKSESPPGPGMPAGAWTTPSPQSASAVFDEAAIRSGKRRSSPHVYAAAKAAADHRKDTACPPAADNAPGPTRSATPAAHGSGRSSPPASAPTLPGV